MTRDSTVYTWNSSAEIFVLQWSPKHAKRELERDVNYVGKGLARKFEWSSLKWKQTTSHDQRTWNQKASRRNDWLSCIPCLYMWFPSSNTNQAEVVEIVMNSSLDFFISYILKDFPNWSSKLSWKYVISIILSCLCHHSMYCQYPLHPHTSYTIQVTVWHFVHFVTCVTCTNGTMRMSALRFSSPHR